MSGFTKGPWECQDSEDSDFIHIGPVNDIGIMEFCVTSVRSEGDSNLIAAAPDMLYELERSRWTWMHVRECWVIVNSKQPDLRGWAEDQIEICNIRIAQHDKAIAKAKGECQ